jgi:hypothetical protein
MANASGDMTTLMAAIISIEVLGLGFVEASICITSYAVYRGCPTQV